MRKRMMILVLLFPVILNPAARAGQAARTTQASQSKSSVEAELAKLPAELRSQAQAMLDEKDDRKRAAMAGGLARRNPEALTDFLVEALKADPSIRLAVVDSLGRHSSPRVRAELASLASSDPDLRVSLLALERLRVQFAQEGRDLLEKRLELARKGSDEKSTARLLEEQERWISLVRGTMLPSFLRVPPPRFQVKAETQAVRFVAFGDFGTGSANQRQVAGVMAEWHRRAPFDFGVTLGDNFYSAGMTSPADPRWKNQWEELYGPLGIKFYATLGNHDWVMSDSPAAEILYSDRSGSWRMPSPYYTFTAGSAQFFAVDTNEMSDAQLAWLDGELKKSNARWKIVYGHHPIYSDGEHGDSQTLKARLLPILKEGHADVYLAGHDHILNHVKGEGGVEFLVSGGGGAGLYKVKHAERTRFAESKNGFAALEATDRELKVALIGIDSKPLYEYTMRK